MSVYPRTTRTIQNIIRKPMKIGQVAETLGTTEDAVRKMEDTGELKPIGDRVQGGHRLYDQEAVMALKAKRQTKIDFLAKAKELRGEKEKRVKDLEDELSRFNGDAVGTELMVEKEYIQTKDGVRDWFKVTHKATSNEIFFASHLEGDIYEYEIKPFHPAETASIDIKQLMQHITLRNTMQIAMQGDKKIRFLSNTQNGTLHDAMMALARHVVLLK